MAKVALLIGVSKYKYDGLTSLPGAAKDIEEMQRIFQNPEIGGFEVKSLLNPDTSEMQTAIEDLFLDRHKDDIVLLYFSGHGIKDDSGKLYFTTTETRKNEQGKLIKSSTVSAQFIHEMINDNRSRSKRQVIILDCCFSGAFANNIKGKDDVYLDFQKIQLGGEGRAVLTSSTSTEYAFESVYTRYLVQGIETGEADKNNDGFISVDELHQYVQTKVQENKHDMKPQIQAVIKEGYNIVLTKTPIGNRENIYKEIVKSWVRNGYISDTGRAALNEQQKRLEIEPDKATVSEEEVLKPYKEYQDKLQLYKEVFSKILQKNYPISNEDFEELNRFKQSFGLRDTDTKKLEDSLLRKWKAGRINLPPLVKLFLLTSLCFGSGFLFRAFTTVSETTTGKGEGNKFCQKPQQYNLATITTQKGLNISSGEKSLLGGDANSEKQAGVNAFASKNFTLAIKHLESWRQSHKNDPETLIYLNNAKASNKSTFKIGVGVPIGTNPNVAQEILRGVAQAQDEANQKGINGKLLQVVIANDDNDQNIAKQIAKKFVEDSNILAVVGHNVSDVSEAAAEVYEEGHLVMISPTSFSLDFSKSRKYIFRTVTNSNVVANVLSNYTLNTANKKNIVICVAENATDNMAFRNSFIDSIGDRWNRKTPCNLSSNLNPNDLIDQAIKNGADSILLAPHVNRINKALEVAQANQGRLALFGSPTLYTSETLQGGQDINGMVLAVPWYPAEIPGNQFPQNARNLWGGSVSWRTAMAYDATKAIIAGLQQSNTREELQQVMHNTANFSADNGATGKIEFLPSGDRKGTAITVKVQPNSQKICEFVQVPAS
ncbi:caspase, EACC1-associated type [Nostoc sp.]|uniref:caspase, EACC1-associated type n=1 Tax=Nostoc sp. TaxID=1180 RepID=UPI002FF69527